MCKDYVNPVQFYLCSATSQQQSPEAALWPLIQIQGAIVQWQPLVSLTKHRSVFLTSACSNRWLQIFRFVLFLENWEQLWHQSLPRVSSCTIGRCACLFHRTTCCTPSHLDTLYWAPGLNLTRPDETRHGCLWSSRARSTACVTLCLSFLAYTLSLCWYKELSLLSHFVQCAEVISFTVTADTTVLFSATQPHTHMHAHTCTHAHMNRITIVPVSWVCWHYTAVEWDTVHFLSVKCITHKHTCRYIHLYPV